MARMRATHRRNRARMARSRQPVAYRFANDPAQWQIDAARSCTRRSSGYEQDYPRTAADCIIQPEVEPVMRGCEIVAVKIDRPVGD